MPWIRPDMAALRARSQLSAGGVHSCTDGSDCCGGPGSGLRVHRRPGASLRPFASEAAELPRGTGDLSGLDLET